MNDIIRTSANINTLWANVFADELARCGVRRVVAAPGSRSTPLVLAFVRHPDIEVISKLDERAAAFFALGSAKVSGTPTALLCTSGTAVANFFPAVCEADASDVPLLVLTADRPAVLQDTGALQTMNQRLAYGAHVRWFHEVAKPELTDAALRYLRSTACHACAVCIGPSRGPVHLNVPFDKPLEPIPSAADRERIEALCASSNALGVSGRPDGRPFTEVIAEATSVDPFAVARLASALRKARRPLIVAGPESIHTGDSRLVARCIDAMGVPVFAEAASGLRFTGGDFPMVLAGGDLLVRSPEFNERMRPDLLILTGGTPTITALQRFIASCEGIPVFSIAASAKRVDPEHVVSFRIHAPRLAVFEALAHGCEKHHDVGIDTAWRDDLVAANRLAVDWMRTRLAQGGEGLQAAFWSTLPMLLPQGAAVVVSNSMTIRDLETFLKTAPTIDLFCNRGLSGIDGLTSTAYGVASQIQRRTVLITGDSAFLHDLGIFTSTSLRNFDLTVFVLNNNGGEIFGTLPIADFEPACTRHFIMPHGMDIAAVATSMGIPALAITNDDNHARALREMGAAQDSVSGFDTASRKRLRVIEIRFAMEGSLEWRRSVIRDVRDELDAFFSTRAPRVTPPSTRRSLAWREIGGRVIRGGIPVVFLHGFTRSSRSWGAMVPDDACNRELLAVDLMGHGASPSPAYGDEPECYSMEYQARAVLDAMDEMGVRRAHLAGYSMGGRLALYLALNAPDRFASLAMMSAGPGIEDAEQREGRRLTDEQLAADIIAKGLAWFIETWKRHPLLQASTPDARAIDILTADRWTQTTVGLAGSLLGMGQGSQESLWARLPGLVTPALCVTGAEDRLYTSIAEHMRERQPALRTEVFDEAGHDIITDAPARLYALLEHFWSVIDASGGRT